MGVNSHLVFTSLSNYYFVTHFLLSFQNYNEENLKWKHVFREVAKDTRNSVTEDHTCNYPSTAGKAEHSELYNLFL